MDTSREVYGGPHRAAPPAGGCYYIGETGKKQRPPLDDGDQCWSGAGRKGNRNVRGCRLGYRCRWGIRGDHGHLMTYKIGSHSLEAIVLTPSPPVIHHDIFT